MTSDREDDDTTSRQGNGVGTAASGPGAPPVDGPADDQALPLGTRLDEFELTDRLGEGGFSIVYLAWDHSLERRVALKEYMPRSVAERRPGATLVSARSQSMRATFELGLRSFINESKLLALFDHPALVKVYRFWEANGTAYMVMPFYEGKTLKDALQGAPEPPHESWLLELLASVTEALGVIHAKDCFHRDIAPDNIMLVAPNDQPLLLDFGAARRVIGDKTQALTVILKPGYAPIEQYADAPGMKQGPWTDVYALSAVMYWAITGKKPAASVSRVLKDNHVPLASIAGDRYSTRFLDAIDHGLALLPENRPQTIHAFRNELGLVASVPQAPASRQRAPSAASPQQRDDEATQLHPGALADQWTITHTPSLQAVASVGAGPASRTIVPPAMPPADPRREPETIRTELPLVDRQADRRDDEGDVSDVSDDDDEPDEAQAAVPAAPGRRHSNSALLIGAAAFSATAVIMWAVMRVPERPATPHAPASHAGATSPAGADASAAQLLPQARVVPTAPASPLDVDSHAAPTAAAPTTAVQARNSAQEARAAPPLQATASATVAHRLAAARTKAPPRAETSAAPKAADSEECARIMQRMSLGESSRELIERAKSFNCH
jgi:serine/threonine protein kinase